MRTVFRWLFRLFLAVLVLGVGFVLLLDTLAKQWLEHELKVRTGLETRIDRLEIGLLNPVLHMEGLKLYNAPEFGGSPFLDIPEVRLEYDWPAARPWRIRLLRVVVQEIHVVESADGWLNLEVAGPPFLNTILPPATGGTASAKLAFGGIDQFNLTIRKFKYNSLRHPQSLADLNLGVEHLLARNIQSREQLLAILEKIAKERGLSGLTDSLRQDRAKQPGSPRPPRIILGPVSR